MKLNHDCIRKLMLYLEEHLELNNAIELQETQIEKFSPEDTIYSALKLQEAGYIRAKAIDDIVGGFCVTVYEITWDGHKFLDTIRDNNVWSKTKNILSKFSSASISFVSTIASQVLSDLIKQQLGMNPTLPSTF